MFKVIMTYSDGSTEELDETFATEQEAWDHGAYMVGCAQVGAEVLHLSNPGDYPEYDPDDDPEFEVVEFDG